MDVAGGLFRYLGDSLGECPHQGWDGVALGAPLTPELLRVEQARFATLLAAGGDGLRGIRWDQADPHLGDR
jgi:hypothetical protein